MRNEGADCFLLAKLGLAGFAILVGLPVLVWFSWLREEKVFWLNEGGYPIWLRELVLATFYPLLLIDVIVLLLGGILLLKSPPGCRRSLWGQSAILALMASTIAYVVIWTLLDHC